MVAGSSGECVPADGSKITLKVNGNSIISSFSLAIQRLTILGQSKTNFISMPSNQPVTFQFMDGLRSVHVCLCLPGGVGKYSVQPATIVATGFNFLCRIVNLKGIFFLSRQESCEGFFSFI